jgi:two-component system phosphate regulon sensor histidine kinase PhoR
MRGRLPFHTWVLGGCLLVVALTLLVVGWLLHGTLKERMVLQVRDGLRQDLLALRELVSTQWGATRDPLELPSLAQHLGRRLGLRVTLITPDGRVAGDSEVARPELPDLENHITRPEVIQALAGGEGWHVRRSASMLTDSLYVAGLLGSRADPQLILRAAAPLTAVEESLARLRRSILWSSLVGIVLSVCIGYLVARRISRPVGALRQNALGMVRDLSIMAERIAGGGPAPSHLGAHGPPEIGDLGRALQTLSERLRGEIQSVTRGKDRLEAILSAMVEAVMVTDGQGRILLTNRAFRGLLGLDLDPVGRTAAELFRKPDLQEAVQEVIEGIPHKSLEIRTLGPARTLEVHVVRLGNEAVESGAVAVFHDVTERKRLEKVRRDFVANVSHELRTPLTAIRGSVETLLSGALDDPKYARHFVEMVQRHVARLQRLLDDLLSLARIESGETSPRREAVPVAELADAVLGTFAELAASLGVELIRDLPREEIAVHGDRRQLEQALLNLLDNALKYTESGGRVTLRVLTAGEEVHLLVSDTGAGIPAEHLPRIFERFYRVDRARSRELGGTGLGLSIVKHIVQSHGGRVEVESAVGRGSSFRIVLPA